MTATDQAAAAELERLEACGLGLEAIAVRAWSADRAAGTVADVGVLRRWLVRVSADCAALVERLRDRGDA